MLRSGNVATPPEAAACDLPERRALGTLGSLPSASVTSPVKLVMTLPAESNTVTCTGGVIMLSFMASVRSEEHRLNSSHQISLHDALPIFDLIDAQVRERRHAARGGRLRPAGEARFGNTRVLAERECDVARKARHDVARRVEHGDLHRRRDHAVLHGVCRLYRKR